MLLPLRVVLCLALISLVAPAHAATVNVAPGQATVLFNIHHDLGYTVGTFNDFAGTLDVDDKNSITALKAQVQVASIDTRSSVRDEGLRSGMFLDAARFPQASFESSGIQGNQLSGTMTIKGVSKPMTLTVEEKPGSVILKGTLDRNDFGITYNSVLPNKKKAIGNSIELTIEIKR